MDSTPPKKSSRSLVLTIFFLLLLGQWQRAPPCRALQPEEVLLIANTRVPEGVRLARYYQKQRQIPADNILLLATTTRENTSREEYEREIAAPVRDFLAQHRERRFSCLTLFYGLPLRILPPPASEADHARSAELKKEKSALQRKKDHGQGDEESRPLLDSINKELARLDGADQEAALDSELALVRLPPYPLARWQLNPFFLGRQNKSAPPPKAPILLVSRIDGPDAGTAKRIIDDSIRVEKLGLRGEACFDARWPYPDGKKKLSGYARYDKSLHDAARLLSQKGFSVQFDSRPELFAEGSSLAAALYCGWYSLGKYVDAFTWQPGAIGYHIASGECRTLKKRESRAWCKMLLAQGVAATIGPVSEPYVQAFPPPALFFSLLTRGDLTLAESYLLSTPFLSWKMVLIGDPLYRPYKARLSSAEPAGRDEAGKEPDQNQGAAPPFAPTISPGSMVH